MDIKAITLMIDISKLCQLPVKSFGMPSGREPCSNFTLTGRGTLLNRWDIL